jgi:F-type H+-transporting ATPase subunit b
VTIQPRSRTERVALAASLAVAVLAPGVALAAEDNLVLIPSLPMLSALLLLFVAMIFPVNALLFRPLLAVLDARSEKIDGTRQRAEKIGADAEEILARYEASVREVREEAERERKQSLSEARSTSLAESASARTAAEREIDRAREQIARDVADARQQLRAQAELLAREAAARVLGREVA